MRRFLTLAIVGGLLFCGSAFAQQTPPPPQYWPAEFQSTCEEGGPYRVSPANGVLWLNELTHTPVSIPFQVGSVGYSGWIWSEGSDLVLSITGLRSDSSGVIGSFKPFELVLSWDEDADAWLITRPVGGSVVEVWAVKLDSGCNPVLFSGYLIGVPGEGFQWYSWRQLYSLDVPTPSPLRVRPVK